MVTFDQSFFPRQISTEVFLAFLCVSLKSNLVHKATSNFDPIKSLYFGAYCCLLPEESVSSHLSKDLLCCYSFELSLKYDSSLFLPESMQFKLGKEHSRIFLYDYCTFCLQRVFVVESATITPVDSLNLTSLLVLPITRVKLFLKFEICLVCHQFELHSLACEVWIFNCCSSV